MFLGRSWPELPAAEMQGSEAELREALKREVRLQTALDVEVESPFAVWPVQPRSLSYLVGYHCRYLSGNVQLSEKHDGFRWVDKLNYRDLDRVSPLFAVLEKFFAGGRSK